jgi:hypothetical protein
MNCMLYTGVHIAEPDVDYPHLPAYTVAVQLLILLVPASRWRVASVLHGVEFGKALHLRYSSINRLVLI